MATVKVSALTAKTSPSGSEELLINDGGTSKKITIANLPDNDTTYTATGLISIDGSNIISTTANNYSHPTGAGNEHLPSSVSQTEAGYLDGVTSAIQTQLDGKISTADDSVTLAQLSATGTASSSTYLRGDNSWATVDALPSQTGHAGKYLTTDATNASWAELDTDANSTTKGLYEHANTISSNYSITSGNNAMSASPITINSGVSVTVPTGSTWVIA